MFYLCLFVANVIVVKYYKVEMFYIIFFLRFFNRRFFYCIIF